MVADTGNARVIDIVTRFYDPVTYAQDGRQRHSVVRLTPTYVRVGSSPRGYERVRYTSAQPIFDPVNNALIGYLCAASNLNQVLVVEAGTQTVNPREHLHAQQHHRQRGLLGLALRPRPDRRRPRLNELLQFENIKHVEARATARASTSPDLHALRRAWATGRTLAAAGPGVFEFIIDVSDPNPDNWGLDRMGAAATWPTDRSQEYGRGLPHLAYDGANHGDGTTYWTQWYPVCARRLRSGEHLIVNSLSMIERHSA